MASPSVTTTPFPPSRDDNAVKLRRQEAANALQRYPVLALHAVRNGEVTHSLSLGYGSIIFHHDSFPSPQQQSPAMMRLKLMR